MILPIVGYGDPVLRKIAEQIPQDYPDLSQIIDNMYQTMYKACGVGLAAPQVGLAIRLFIIDCQPFADSDDLTKQEKEQLQHFKKTFINPKIVAEEGEFWVFNEGCLSIPDIREDVTRKEKITIQYQDENFVTKTEVYDGLIARVIQHEYDHIEGILFTDHIAPLKKQLLKKKLQNIIDGKANPEYRMKFVAKKR